VSIPTINFRFGVDTNSISIFSKDFFEFSILKNFFSRFFCELYYSIINTKPEIDGWDAHAERMVIVE
jgi:hypothetical protein